MEIKSFSCIEVWKVWTKGWHFYCRWRSRRCDLLIVFCVKRPSNEGAPLGWGIEICGRSSCQGGLRSLLNTEGILTLPMFLLNDGSLMWMWSASFARWCKVLLSLSIIVKSSSSAFGCFVEMWWFLMSLVVWFLWSKTLFFQGPVGFTYVFSCAVVGWAFPVVDYISFLCIWSWIFWMHE